MEQLSSSDRWRSFISLGIPPEVKSRLAEVQDSLRRSLPGEGFRWTRQEQFHLTLRFLGAVRVSDIDALTSELNRVCAGFPELRLSASGIGFFPNARRPRVLWVGVDDERNQLLPLQEAIDEATARFSPEASEKRFTGHLTLARIQFLSAGEGIKLSQSAAELSAQHFGTWDVKAVDLMRSELSPKGARHSTLCSAPLQSSHK